MSTRASNLVVAYSRKCSLDIRKREGSDRRAETLTALVNGGSDGVHSKNRGDRKGVHSQGVRVIKCHRLFLVYLWSNATQKLWLFLEMA